MSGLNAQQKALVKRYVGEDVWAQGKARAVALVVETAEAERKTTSVLWSWGDLSLEIVPMMNRGGNSRLQALLLDAFVGDYGCTYTRGSLNQCRRICARWPKDRRVDTAGFGTHRVLAYHDDRYELIRNGMTVSEAQALINRAASVRLRAGTATAIQCANAARSWARSLAKRLDDNHSEDLIIAASDAWVELAGVCDSLGILDELLNEFYERQSGDLQAAA